MKKLTCFKAYDIRGKLGEELNEDIAWRIGRAYGEFLKPKTIVLGGDVRLTSETLKLALARGLQDAGVDVLDIGMSGTEEIYFATFHLGVDGGIEVTASHNPMDYNGMKLVREGARPISGDTGLRDVQRLAEANDFPPVDETKRGRYQQINLRDAYVDHLFGYINVKNLTPLKLVINSGNGAAGPVVDAIEARFKALGAPVELIKVHNTPDGNFPNGIPNPLLPECRDDTRNAVIKHGADMGIAFDGDFDRCFLFDEKGQFIEGYYIVGLLAEAFLEKNPGAKIIHDPRLSWNTIDVVTAAGGTPVMSKTGHAFIKERMRKEDAIYGGEMSAHHYFRDFAYCDSGMIPWLLVAELLCLKGKTLGDAKAGKIHNVYIAMQMCDGARVKKLVHQLADTTCSVLLIPDVFTFNILHSRLEEMNGVPVVPLYDTPLSGVNRLLKRAEDIVLATLILLLISPVLCCIALAVKLSSPGPVIFRQTRYGMDGKPIKVWKFRSMKVMENDKVVTQATQNDPRVTKVGNFLRRTSLDELPQFINVLTGGMSIVGPRPHAVAHNEQYRQLIEGYMLRHKVKPGITGWAQINGWRGETDTLEKMEKRVEFDLEYIREWSVWFDIKIVFLTVFKGFVNKAAY
ncbi:TPA: undecaprenyl-phosphate glucose phosphotransferase [Escherichia coli]